MTALCASENCGSDSFNASDDGRFSSAFFGACLSKKRCIVAAKTTSKCLWYDGSLSSALIRICGKNSAKARKQNITLNVNRNFVLDDIVVYAFTFEVTLVSTISDMCGSSKLIGSIVCAKAL